MRRRESRIHKGLVGERALVGSAYMADPDLRREYDEDIAPRTRAALTRLLDEVGQGRRVRRALDLGAGTGAAGALLRERHGPALDLVSVDQVGGPGILVADLRRDPRPRGVSGRFDLVVAAHVLNELGKSMTIEARARLVEGWCRELLADDGLCVILEPALRETARDLLAVRDRVVAAGFFVVAPCLFQGPCPALARARDWCHDAAPWEAQEAAWRPPRSRVDYTPLVLARAGRPSDDARLFRVVSDPLPEKGRLRVFGCGPAGRHALVRLDRERSADNAALEEVVRGEVITVDGGTAAGDGLRVGETTQVRRQSSTER